MAKYIQKQISNKDLVAENEALRQQLNSMQQNGNAVKTDSKFVRVVDTCIATHTTPCSNPNGVMLHLRGKNRNYQKFTYNELLPKIPFGQEFNVWQYIKTEDFKKGIRKPSSLAIKAGNLTLFGFGLEKKA